MASQISVYAAGDGTCTNTCHVVSAGAGDWLDAGELLCAQCHGAESMQATLGAKMWTEYQAAVTQIEKAATLITTADEVPIQTEDYRARLEERRTYLREALPAAHSVDEQTVAGLTTRAHAVGAEVAPEIYGKLGHLQARKVGLVVFWFYLALTVVILRRLQSRAARKD